MAKEKEENIWIRKNNFCGGEKNGDQKEGNSWRSKIFGQVRRR